MTDTIKGKNIWITGAGSGIGKQLALSLAAAGNRVVISGRSQDKLENVWLSNRQNISTMVCDVSNDLAVEQAREQLQRELGHIDIAIFNAGHCEYIENGEVQTALFRRVYDVNVFGVVNSLAIALPLLRRPGASGTERTQIIGIASLSAVVGLPRAEAYGSSKAALNYMLESLRLAVAKDGIDVTVVNPGFVKTPMTDVNDFPMPFLMDAESAAQRIVKGIANRELKVQFPRRLHFFLALAARFPTLWYRRAGKMLSRVKRTEPLVD